MQGFVPQIKISNILTPIDWVVFVGILILTIGAVIYGNTKKKKQINKNDSEESFLDLLLMGRQLTLPLFVATLVATWYGGIFGVTAIAFKKGIYNFLTQGIFWYVAYIIFAFFLVKRIKASNAVTLPEMIGQMFGKKAAKLSAIFNFFNLVPIAYAISLGLFIQGIFGGNLSIGIILGVLFVLIYSLYGGFRAIVFSDLIQFFVMCLGVLLVVVFSVGQFGGISFLRSNLPETHFSWFGGGTFFSTLIWGFIALSTLVDPNFYQRCFAAKSTKVARRGILISTGVWLVFDICTTAGAMYARAVIPEAKPGTAYLIYAVQVLPPGLRGFILAGILATILSTLDSYIFTAGTTISYDLLPKKWRLGGIIKHHLGVVFVGVIAVLMSFMFKGDIKAVWKTLGSYSAACLLLPVMFGQIFPKKISDNQFVFSCLLGVLVITVWRNIKLPGLWGQVDELYAGIVATSFGLTIWYFIKKIVYRLK